MPSDTDAAAVSFLICTDISLGSAPPGYAAAAQAPVWAPRCQTAPPLGWPGRESGHVPFRIEGAAARLIFLPLLFRVIGHRVLTVDTPIGRKMRPRLLSHAAPLVRVRPKDLAAAKIQRVPRVAGVRDGRPLLRDQRALEVANVIWCTGYRPDFSWIDLPVLGESEPLHHRGIVASEPGLYFVGLFFLYAMSSDSSPASGGTPSTSPTTSPRANPPPAGGPGTGRSIAP